MIARFMVFVAVVLFVFLGSAAAQTQGGEELPPSAMGGVRRANDDQTTAVASFGWNLVHAVNCWSYLDDETSWFNLFDGQSIWYTSNSVAINTLSPACQTGNLLGFYVYSLQPTTWSHAAVYPYK